MMANVNLFIVNCLLFSKLRPSTLHPIFRYNSHPNLPESMRMLSEYVEVHPLHPKPRLIETAAKALLDGGVIIYPTDSMYALGCKLGNKSALTRICRIRRLDERHQFTLICGCLLYTSDAADE